MKSSLLRTFFEWALITSVLMSVGFFAFYFMKSRAARASSSQIAITQTGFQYNRTVMAMLLSECQAYARTNADMARLLGPMSPAPVPAANSKPGAK
jgi:hypothetical protein